MEKLLTYHIINIENFTVLLKGGFIMELTVRGKNLEVTEALHAYVEKHTGKIQRYFDKPLKINVLMRISNMTKTCEVTVFVDGVILRGVEKSNDMYKSIDLVFDKVERQIHKYKTRLARKFKGKDVMSQQFIEEKEQSTADNDFEIVRQKRFVINSMTPEEAVLQMNLLGHSFFMFYNIESDGMAVVYRRNDGKYGLIDSEHN
ncbi:ribosomal subunit interface protein [Veillonellaceae bacterium DNF00626]|nr:ribosomal subunit interface protein [Veillonellaceae bacterium DNF00626]